jgi:putative redox protein
LAGTPERLEGAAEEDDDGVELDLGGPRPVRVRRQLLADLAADHLRNVLAHLGKGLLIFHSPVDRVVGIDNAERLFLEARHPKSFVSLGGADHLLSDPRDAAHVGAVLGAWAERYLPAGADAADHGRPGSHIRVASAATGGAATALGETGSRRQENDAASDGSASDGPASAEPALPHGVVEVTGLPHSLRQEVRVGTHHLVADEPVADGGTDAGPTPYGLLLAALGACTSMTLRLYAERKKVPLGEVRVRLRHVREHARDCETCAENNTRIERIERDLELAGALTEEQRARLLEIADRCPVHRTLTSQVQIVTRLR